VEPDLDVLLFAGEAVRFVGVVVRRIRVLPAALVRAVGVVGLPLDDRAGEEVDYGRRGAEVVRQR
jgi:hypothetical protein